VRHPRSTWNILTKGTSMSKGQMDMPQTDWNKSSTFRILEVILSTM
ncbi:unnamed protein product, partial [Porites lobata]